MFPVVLDEVLPVKLFYDLSYEMRETWGLGNSSTMQDDKGGSYFWGMQPHYCQHLHYYRAATHIGMKVRHFLKTDLIYYRMHINGQLNGQSSGFHTDTLVPGSYTFVLYTNDVWDTEWGGETILNLPGTREYKYVSYVPNRGTFFPSDWQHKGCAPNNKTTNMRTSLAFFFCHPWALKPMLEENPKRYRPYLPKEWW